MGNHPQPKYTHTCNTCTHTYIHTGIDHQEHKTNPFLLILITAKLSCGAPFVFICHIKFNSIPHWNTNQVWALQLTSHTDGVELICSWIYAKFKQSGWELEDPSDLWTQIWEMLILSVIVFHSFFHSHLSITFIRFHSQISNKNFSRTHFHLWNINKCFNKSNTLNKSLELYIARPSVHGSFV